MAEEIDVVGIDVTTSLLFTLSDDVQQNETVRVSSVVSCHLDSLLACLLVTALHRFA